MKPAERYEAFLLDLDGVLYRGQDPVPGASETLAALRETGKRLVFLTNNSWWTPGQVAEKLQGMGIPAEPDEVVTSGQATAGVLAREGGTGKTAYVLGGDGVRSALAEAGIEPVDGKPERVDYVVVGWDGDLTYERLRMATVLVGRGARLVATNDDASYPAPGGELWPGAGAILAAVETGAGRQASVIGKPHRPLFDLAIERAASRQALVVGDRLETDIEGATAAGLDSALVLTGASTPADVLDVDAVPTAILRDLRDLVSDRPWAAPRRAGQEDLEAVWALAGRPEGIPGWGPEGVWISGDRDLLATATAEVKDDDAYLRAVATMEDVRGFHLGTQVVAAAIRDAARRGAPRCWLLTESAEGYFDRLGFELSERSDLPSWIVAGPAETCPASAVAMCRDLVR
ncbi:MAG: HAD-IIA family hydrolase [Actinomycetota bacterium]